MNSMQQSKPIQPIKSIKQKSMAQKSIAAMLLLVLLTPQTTSAVDLDIDSILNSIKGNKGAGVRSDDIPAGRQGYLWSMGPGPIDRINIPPVLSITPAYGASFNAGLGYSCGKFDPFANVQGIINSAVDKFKALPQMFVTAATSAISALPAYLLNKINPSLYNVVTKNLDDSFDLFDTNFKSCQQMEAEAANGQNPYQDLFRLAMADRQRVEIANNNGSQTIDVNIKARNENGADNGLPMAGGKRVGGKGQPPINAVKEVVVAGYNLMIGHSDTTAVDSSNTDHPINKVFKTPKDAVDWVKDVYGQHEISLPDHNSSTTAKAGVGYRLKYEKRKLEITAALRKYVYRQIDRKQFEKETHGIVIAPIEIHDMREMEPYARDIAIDYRARSEATRDIRQHLIYLSAIVRAGLNEPNIIQSMANSSVVNEASKVYGEIQEDLFDLERMGSQG